MPIPELLTAKNNLTSSEVTSLLSSSVRHITFTLINVDISIIQLTEVVTKLIKKLKIYDLPDTS